MKKIFTSCLVLFCLTSARAQKEFAQEWKSQFPVSTEWRIINDERTFVVGGDMTEIAMMDAVTGKILWTMNFKEKLGQKKAKDWNYDKKAHTVWVDVKGEKKDEVITHYYKEATGEEISEQQYKELQAEYEKTIRWVPKGTLVVQEHSTDVWLDYEKKKIVKSTGKGSKNEITVKAKGTYTWSTNLQVNYVRTLCTNAIPQAAAAFGGDFLKIMYARDKVFIIYEGLSVLDIKTGKLLWQAELDNAEFDFGVFKSTQTLGRAGYPFADETGVYLADLSKGQYRIKKYDINTGALLWQSEQFEKDDVVPDLQINGNILLAQFGGRLEMQSYIPGTNGAPDVCKSEYKFAGNAGVKAYDVNTGKILWETSAMKELGDKFGGAITNIVISGQTAFVASDKNLYAFDAAGKAKFIVPMKSLKIGKPTYLFSYGSGTLIMKAEEGIASISMNDGKVNYATNTDKCLRIDQEGNACIIWTGKEPGDLSAFIRMDLETGKILGKIDDTSYPFFSPDGEHFIKFEGAKVMRYSTK